MGVFEFNLEDLPRLRDGVRAFWQAERYRCFAELAANEQEGVTWARTALFRSSPVCIIAPHGGNMETGTSECARALAGSDFSLYLFESLKAEGDWSLHIASQRFDDPVCLQMAQRSRLVVTVHGCLEPAEAVFIGGKAHAERRLLLKELRQEGFVVMRDRLLPGLERRNICNLGTSGAGIQLELSMGLRQHFSSSLHCASLQANSRPALLLRVLSDVLRSLCEKA